MPSDQSSHIRLCLRRLQAGDASARDDLLAAARSRLLDLTRAMLRGYVRLRRFEETDDVLQGALMRLHRAVQQVAPTEPRDFYRLATTQIRRELIDLARHYFGPQGHGRHLVAQEPRNADDSTQPPTTEPQDASLDPTRLAAWTDFHRQVEALSAEEQEVFSLIWYQGLTQVEAAEVMGVSARTVLRRWQSACLTLHDALQGLLP